MGFHYARELLPWCLYHVPKIYTVAGYVGLGAQTSCDGAGAATKSCYTSCMQIWMSVSKVITTVQSMLSVKTSMGDSPATVTLVMREMEQHVKVIQSSCNEKGFT